MVSLSYTDTLQRGLHAYGPHDSLLHNKIHGSREVPVDVFNISPCDRKVLVSWIRCTLRTTNLEIEEFKVGVIETSSPAESLWRDASNRPTAVEAQM